MENAKYFREKIGRGQLCLGTSISFTDPTVTEALCNISDFVMIDTEHRPLPLDTVQAHIMATKGSETTPLVRVAWNDAVLMKGVLDVGAAGVIVPFVNSAEEARLAVAACLYPPKGIRGFGPRRPSNYALLPAEEVCRRANEDIIIIVQIEHIEAVQNLDDILAVEGLTGVFIGSFDLSGSMGVMGQNRHPDVLAAIDSVISKARARDVMVGIGVSAPDEVVEWAQKGVQFAFNGEDYTLMLQAGREAVEAVRKRLGA